MESQPSYSSLKDLTAHQLEEGLTTGDTGGLHQLQGGKPELNLQFYLRERISCALLRLKLSPNLTD